MDLGSDSRDIERKGEFEDSEDNFKSIFKRYKNRSATNLNLSEVVDFGLVDVCSQFEVTKREVKTDIGDDVCSHLGLKLLQEWKAFSLNSAPGFIFILNPFKFGHQRYWLKRLLQDVPNPTNKTNIPDGFPVSEESVWDLHCQRYPTEKKSTFSQLRWVTLGYHYNWNTKLYDPEDRSPFPEDIGILSSFVAASVGFQNFKAEAAIVNYYKMNSTLGGHNDHSELDHDAPLISFSFGQSAIFLVGGLTKSVTPTPILLRSGDIIILSSSSRLAFHGVPKIMHDDPENLKRCWGVNTESKRKEDKLPTWFKSNGEEDGTCTGISEVVLRKREPKAKISCNRKGRDNIMTIERCEESEIRTADEKRHHSSLPSTTIEKFNLEGDFCKEEKERLSDDENNGDDGDHQIIKCRRASPVSDYLERKTESKRQFQILKGDQTMGNYCTGGQVTENDNLQGYPFLTEFYASDEKIASSSLKQRRIDSAVTDCCPSLRIKFPNIDNILQSIDIETERILQNVLWEPFEKHLQNARLNVSVRQVNNTSVERS